MEMKQLRWQKEIEEERRTRMAKDEAEQRSRLLTAVHVSETAAMKRAEEFFDAQLRTQAAAAE
eukprot:9806451-Prorocentrum_lima.AAC.1